MQRKLTWAAVAIACALLAACGSSSSDNSSTGGGGSGGTDTGGGTGGGRSGGSDTGGGGSGGGSGGDTGGGSTTMTDQQKFEAFALAGNGGQVSYYAYLPDTGTPAIGTHYFLAGTTSLASSPAAAGAQNTTWRGAAQSALLTDTKLTADRYLAGGSIVVSPNNPAYSRVSYVGSAIQIDALAQDQSTVVYSTTLKDLVVTSHSGLLSASPDTLRAAFSNLFTNSSLLLPGKSWQTGSASWYGSLTRSSDIYYVEDCISPVTTGINVTPCLTNTTLNDYIAAFPPTSSTGAVLAGSTVTIQGLQAWVATNAQTSSVTGASYYPVFFSLNGSVYYASLFKSGADLGYTTRLNQAAAASIKDALAF